MLMLVWGEARELMQAREIKEGNLYPGMSLLVDHYLLGCDIVNVVHGK